MARSADISDLAQTTNLLLSIAEQLKSPLTNIARQAELGLLIGETSPADFGLIRMQADTALSLVDSYLLGLQLADEQGSLQLEPVSVASTLVETAHELDAFAKQYNVDLEVRVAGKYEPVMAHSAGLKAALKSLGYGLIEAQAAGQSALSRRAQLTLAAHRTPHGIVAGVYGDYEVLGAAQWRKALALCGRARQPFTALSSSSAAGLFVAEAILQAMTTRLRVGRYQKQSGLATTLQPSRQLQLV